MKEEFDFGKALYDFMELHELSQKDISDATDLNPVAINRYVNGRRVPKINTIVKMADNLKISLDELCGRKKYEDHKRGTGKRENR